jgi:hypothetical protein
MNTITLTLTADGWMATFAGPHAATIQDLFGTTTIPTAFYAGAHPDHVRAEIAKGNPDATVTLASTGWEVVPA